MSDTAKLALSIRLDVYDNAKVRGWVNGSFGTELERSAAWAMFGHLCNEYPDVQKIVRGELVRSTEEEG